MCEEKQVDTFFKINRVQKNTRHMAGYFLMTNAFKSVGIAEMVEAINAPIGAGPWIERAVFMRAIGAPTGSPRLIDRLIGGRCRWIVRPSWLIISRGSRIIGRWRRSLINDLRL